MELVFRKHNNTNQQKWLMRIKLLIVIMTTFLMQVSASGFAQHFSLNKENISLKNIFTEIKKQTNYTIIYRSGLIKNRKPINVNLYMVSLKEAMLQILKNQNIDYTIEDKVVVLKEKENGFLENIIARFQEIDVRGTVVNAEGLPLAGAVVKVKHTARQTITNEQGEFYLDKVSDQAVLLVSYVGYEPKEVPAETRIAEIRMVVREAKLDEVEVISTGYQDIPKERATGSFNTINNKTFNEQVSRNILDRLEAVANGLAVDRYTGVSSGNAEILIRGRSTIQGVKGPLIILDNFPYNGNIENINPNDVENITILKDAAAASIWGTKAGNGVIVINTKKGKYNQPTRIDFNANISFTGKPDLYSLPLISSSDAIDVERFQFANKYKFSDTANVNRPPFSPVYEILFKQDKGLISKESAEAQIEAFRGHDIRNDLDKYFYQTAVSQQYAMSASGGSVNYSWLLSSGYDRGVSQLAAKSSRLNLQLNNSWRVTQKLNFNAAIYLAQSESGNTKPGYFNLRTTNGMLPVYTRLADESGQPVPVIKDYRQDYLDRLVAGGFLDWNFYPMDDYKHVDISNKIFDLTGNLGASYSILPGLSIDLKYQYERQQNNNQTVSGINSYFTRNLINQFTEINAATKTLEYRVPKGAIADFSENLMQSHQFRTQLNFNKNWGNHAINAIIGNEIRHIESPEKNYRTYGYDPQTMSHGNVDYVNFYTVQPYGQLGQIMNNDSFNKRLNRFVSFYTNAAYTYAEKYTVSVSGRRDASNLFGVNTNDKWTPLWSAGLGYQISKEAFYDFATVPYLKLRASYGFSGNVDPSKSALTTITYSPFGNEYTQLPYAYISRYGNPELKWERVRTVNLGLDFESKNGIIKGSVEYYEKKGSDLFGAKRIDYSSGITSGLTMNVAGMRGRGWDINLNTQNLNTGLKWNTTLNLSTNKDQVTDYYQKSPKGSDYISTSPLITALVGKPVYAMFSFKWKGLDPFTGDPVGYVNGHESKNYAVIYGDSTKLQDLVYHGSVMPTLFGSLGNDFSWKGLSLSVRIMYKFGYYFRRPSLNYTSLFDQRQGNKEYANRWQKSGDEQSTQVPSMVYPLNNYRDLFYNGAEINVEKGDHIRLKYITIGYDLKHQKLLRMPFKSLRIYSSINDVGMIWKANKKGLDPDYASGLNIYPSKTISFGLSATL